MKSILLKKEAYFVKTFINLNYIIIMNFMIINLVKIVNLNVADFDYITWIKQNFIIIFNYY